MELIDKFLVLLYNSIIKERKGIPIMKYDTIIIHWTEQNGDREIIHKQVMEFDNDTWNDVVNRAEKDEKEGRDVWYTEYDSIIEIWID